MLHGIKGFDWDEWNINKSEIKHGVTAIECEQVFWSKPIIIVHDASHSQVEERYIALGRTYRKRQLCIAFTMRSKKIRVISARPMSRKERKIYENELR